MAKSISVSFSLVFVVLRAAMVEIILPLLGAVLKPASAQAKRNLFPGHEQEKL